MMGDYHVRFCERLGVKFPLPTRHTTVRQHNFIVLGTFNFLLIFNVSNVKQNY